MTSQIIGSDRFGPKTYAEDLKIWEDSLSKKNVMTVY